MAANPQFGFALEYFSPAEMEAARSFYVDVLGLTPKRSHPTYVEFDHFAIASDESLSGRGEPELYWLVDDAEGTFHELSAKGKVSMPLRDMPFGKVFALEDPAGRPRFMLEFAKDRPSQPVS